MKLKKVKTDGGWFGVSVDGVVVGEHWEEAEVDYWVNHLKSNEALAEKLQAMRPVKKNSRKS